MMTNTRPVALDLQDIHKNYGSLHVLKGVSLTAHDGDVISILGSSGSGKSTLLRCINLLENPSQGKIILGGEELQLIPKMVNYTPKTPNSLKNFAPKWVLYFKILIYGHTKRFWQILLKAQHRF